MEQHSKEEEEEQEALLYICSCRFPSLPSTFLLLIHHRVYIIKGKRQPRKGSWAVRSMCTQQQQLQQHYTYIGNRTCVSLSVYIILICKGWKSIGIMHTVYDTQQPPWRLLHMKEEGWYTYSMCVHTWRNPGVNIYIYTYIITWKIHIRCALGAILRDLGPIPPAAAA